MIASQRPTGDTPTRESGCRFRVVRRFHADLAAETSAVLGLLRLPESPAAHLIRSADDDATPRQAERPGR